MDMQVNPLTTGHGDITATGLERRSSDRTRTVYRIARVRSAADEGLARVRNISDGGMQLAIGIALVVGDAIEVSLSEALTFDGSVVWMRGGACGLRFSRHVDCDAVLRLAAEEARLGKARPPRLSFSQPAVVVSERGLQVAHLYDISQRGMKIGHDGSFQPGLSVKVMVGPGIERRGIVRWVRDDLAGVILTEPFSIQELGSASAL